MLSGLLFAAILVLVVLALRARAEARRLHARLAEAEAQVQEQVDRLALLAETLPQALWLGSAEGETLFMNRRFTEIAGHDLPPSDAEGTPGSVHPDDVERFRAARTQALSTSTASSLEVRLRSEGGAYRWWLVRVIPHHDAAGRVLQWVGSYTDIHAIKLAEEELRRGEERYRQILNTSHDAVVLVDKDSIIRFANQTVESVFGHKVETLLGSPLGLLQPPRLREGHLAGMKRYLQSGERRLDWTATEVPALHRDGHEFPVEVAFAEIQQDGERLFVAFMRDLSERRDAERQRLALEQRLREAQKLEAVGTLAGGIAHQFNNSLAAILGNLHLAAEVAKPEPELERCLEEIRVAAGRARALVRQILTFSRQQPLVHRLCDLQEVVNGAVEFLRGTLPVRVAITVTCRQPLPAALADPEQVELALVSLATNAVEAIGSGVGRIVVNLDAVDFSEAEAAAIPGLQRGAHVRITVEDNGKGMEAETLRRIFEPFFTTGSAGLHAGIGLSVVHGIVSAHHGAVTADSTPGIGSRFTLYFPAVAGAVIPPAPSVVQVPAVPPSRERARILYVDDEAVLVDLVRRLLERRGFSVTTYTDAEQALAAVESAPDAFDVVLTDYNMPKLSGLDLARALRRLRPGLPVAILSGYVNEPLRGEAEAAGVRDVLYKENLVEDLCDRIEELAREYAS